MKYIFWALIVSTMGLAGLMYYNTASMDVESLILCASNEEGIYIPAPLCRLQLIDVSPERYAQELSAGAGLGFVLAGNNSEVKLKLAEHFVKQGVSVDAVDNIHNIGIPPLHGSILLRDFIAVEFLLNHGADPSIKASSNGLTAPELASELYKKSSEPELASIIDLLTQKAESN